MKKEQSKRNKGRPVLNEGQKVDREILKEKFLENSIEALDTIVHIMRYSMDSASRLKASTFILNKIIPDGFVLETNQQSQDITINLISKGEALDIKKTEQIIASAEQIVETIDSWDIETEDSGDWGEQIYQPQKKAKKVSTE